ncbi:MAG: phosphoribosylamine--glycine ligase [Flavobacteriales bacterium]
MNVLVLGSGGREHTVSWKLAQSSLMERLYIAPGNAGTAQIGENVDLDPLDFGAIAEFVQEKEISIVFVGPEQPLVEGIKDYFSDRPEIKTSIIGPSASAARLEGSKNFAKQFMEKHNIPTAKSMSFTKSTKSKASGFLATLKPPYVIKADGLAAGKGVIICETLKEAKTVVKDMLINKAYGEAGKRIVIEEYLDGIEVSMFVVTDGNGYKILPSAKDYKRVGEGDSGPNTGGMGAISPVPIVSREFMEKAKNQVIIPTLKGLKADEIDFEGFVFFGLMKVGGDPYVIEYNVRLGDPETEVIIPRIKSDLLHIMDGIATKTLSECDVEIDERTVATVMLTAKGYPDKYKKGDEISGLEEVKKSMVFHAGTKLTDQKVKTNGGRVMAITSYGVDMENALKKSYESIEAIEYKGKSYRKDIGFDLIKDKAVVKA